MDGLPLGPRGVPRALQCRPFGAEGTDHTAFRTRQVLLPPKPNELETATRTGPGRASLGTWQRSHSGSGSTRLMVGGRARCSMATRQASASTAAAAVTRCPVMLLVELTGTECTASPKTASST